MSKSLLHGTAAASLLGRCLEPGAFLVSRLPSIELYPSAMPLPSQPLFTAKDSPILDFYPKTFKVGLASFRHTAWRAGSTTNCFNQPLQCCYVSAPYCVAAC